MIFISVVPHHFYHSNFSNPPTRIHEIFILPKLGDMAVRLMNGGTAIFRCCAVSPPLTALRCCVRHRNHVQLHSSTCFSISRRLRCRRISFGYDIRRYSAQSLVDLVVEELESLRKRGLARASNKYGNGYACFFLFKHNLNLFLNISVAIELDTSRI